MATGPQTYLLLREAHAAKLGPRSVGAIVFQVLTDPERQALFLRIAGNEGGGYVSDEAVSVQAIRQCISEQPADEPLRAASFKPAFIGKSNNNSGFMTAILVHEGLLSRDAEKTHLMTDTGRWDAWCTEHMAIGGELTSVRVGKEVHTPTVENEAAEGNPVAGADQAADGEVPAVDDDVEPEKPARGRRKARADQA
ncbi:hypothetical protein [Roseateles puraquae]|uniref:hypothetical protein n=1 Tax=Roseateles puraquae TaxID=431059 RepID=UPI0031D5B704